ncbi:MAG TPA: aminotransferase class I/II-fold pyridoxal phosphate-dependent enzyme [Acidimicrobiales bacterium]|jgi:methionine-gamma-lyase|nr:aminotransferase class I/II-fold pyridoxal phosphate-dependent enzyme [Acidimicrobiales bacterium]
MVTEPSAAEHRGGGRRFATRAVQGTEPPLPAARPLAPPIHQASTFSFADAEGYTEALGDPEAGYAYTRYRNPTTAALEATVADLEGGAHALATASGMAAISTVAVSLCGPGDELVVGAELYGGTYSLLTGLLDRLGLVARFVDASDPEAVRGALSPRTRAVYVETIANPTMTVVDLPALATVAHGAGASLVVDNTVASPYLCRPLEHGADVVVHSVTKYLAGHSDVVGGLAVFADADRYRAAWHAMIDLGGSPDPFASWLALRGVRTLSLRMDRHCASARVVADALAAHPGVAAVHWPGLASHPSHDVAARLLDGPGGLLSFDLRGDRAAGRRLTEATCLARLAPSLGGVETLVSHPASTTHRQLGEEALAAAGVGPAMVRVSVGLEDPSDIVADLLQAVVAATSETG